MSEIRRLNMSVPSYIKIEGIPGSVNIIGREETIQVLAFDHKIHIPVNRKDGHSVAARIHDDFVFTKNIDKASPSLYNCLCNGNVIPKVELFWYEIKPTGSEEIYFTHILENVRIISINTIMPDANNQKNEQNKHMERIALRYEKITWRFEEGNIEYSDSWKENR